MPRFDAAHISQIDPLPGADPGWIPLRHRFGVQAFGVNAWVASHAGHELIEEHDESPEGGTSGHEELYYVARGRATFTIDGEEVDAPEGTVVFVGDPSAMRKAVAASAGTTILSVGAAPGEAFEVSPWERKYLTAA